MARLTPFPITPPPGVVLTESERVIEGRFIAASNVRFVRQRPQKIGGYLKAVSTPTSGVPRTLHAWRDLSFNSYLAAGTYRKLYVYDTNFAQNDITPFRATGTLGTNPFTTTNGSSIITVAHSGNGVNAGDTVIFAGATGFAGIAAGAFNTALIVITSTNTSYTVDCGTVANASTSGGGASVTYSYEIPVGVELGVYGLGWGAGGWGLGTWGTPRTSSTIYIEPRVWSLDHFGVLLLASYNGGTIYQFDPTAAQPWGRATSVDATAPTDCRAMFVTPERFVFALRDGLNVSWPSQGTLNVWTPTATNTANTRTLTEGSKLVGGRVLSDFVSLVWTDAALYRFQYTGSTFVYNSSMVAKDCGLISPNAAVTIGGVAYWMGQNNFYMYNGAVQPMPNVEDIRKRVFDALNINCGYQCEAIYNPRFNEIWFFYTINGQTSPTLGLIYAIDDQVWTPLGFGRAGGTHLTQGDTRPYMATSDGNIYQHENGLDADGSPFPYSFQISPYAVNEGQSNSMLEYLVMDFEDQAGNITVQLDAFDRLNDSTEIESETETVTPLDSGTIDCRIAGRYLGLTISGTGLGCYMRLGKPVAFTRTIGTRS